MEDTLRYFFSAIFQGFAAIITLGIMFYLYYMDKQSRKVDEIERELMMFKPSGLGPDGEERLKYFLDFSIIEYMREYSIKRRTTHSQADPIYMRVNKYDSIIKQKELLSDNLKILFKIARMILICSLLSLFLVGYFYWLNIVLEIAGIILIILSIIFFARLFSFSKTIIEGTF